ncbi:MAG: Gfo/Idh/MocA family oxidoreductase [Phycisphaerales bacterium]|nr:Gfo/Idh/MocA family oxidoreductase [Phycisphaerales bacterium]
MTTKKPTDPNLLMSRRAFTASTAAIGAAAVFARPSFGAIASLRGENTLRVGVVGCGGRGTGAVIQALKADPGSVLWAMGDVFEEKIGACLHYANEAMLDLDDEQSTDTWAKKIRVEDRRFSGFDAIHRVLSSGVDVVILTTPPGFRPEHLRHSIEANKHVFCEKPVAVDAPGVRSVLESARLAKEKSLALMSGFCWRYQDQVKETFDKIHAGGIGELHTIQTTYNTTGWVEPKPRKKEWSDAEFQLRNWQYFTPLSADHVAEQAVHAIDWQAWAMKDRPPLRCFGVGGRQTRPDLAETGNVWDHFSLIYEYAGGVRTYHMCRHWPNTPSDNSAYFLGSAGNCVMQPWNGTHTIEGENPWKGSAKSNDMYQREHDVLFRAIRDGTPVNDGVRMSHSSLLAIMGRMAAYTGQVVTWEQAVNSQAALNTQPWAFGDRPTPAMVMPGTSEVI